MKTRLCVLVGAVVTAARWWGVAPRAQVAHASQELIAYSGHAERPFRGS